ncbi:extracellular solute-binding protein [Neisseria leonii]|uniref:Extracellular solute-binding protein n=1 Tax=Neisseria leonii TaxID=2995413 RepID=A0A9X4EAG8_9NEIS|nr:extracellular solute-binding protein [Neisseria sp. 51.81]MDD9328388.1 extracellular solute-binding protein [Neisseria sp. 51.81]
MNKTYYPAALLAAFCCSAALAAHGIALGSAPRYPASFPHFSYVNPDAPKGGSLTLPAQGGFDSLNPFTLKGSPPAGIDLTLDTLAEQSWDEPFAMYGLLAQDIAPAADGLSVTFTLNPRARFHNGDPVQAEDAVYSFRTLTQDPAASPAYRFYWADVAAAEALDSRRVRFRFKKRNAELHMILGQLPVFSRKSFPNGLAGAADRAPIGSGPYRLLKTETNRSAEYRRDPAYWGQSLPVRRGMFNFDTVRFRYYRDPAVRVEGIKAGRYDFAQENTARDWARAYPDNILKKRGLTKQSTAHSGTAGMQGFVMNQRRSLFADVRVRRALVLSFDFESLNSRLFYQSYRRSDSFFTNSTLAARGLPDADEKAVLTPLKPLLPDAVFTQPAPVPPAADPDLGIRPNLNAARALLEEAGYRYRNGRLISPRGKPVEIELLTSGKTFERLAAKWQRDLAKIGITLDIRPADPAVYQKRLNHFDFDITTVVYANSESPGNEQAGYFSCAAAKTPGSRNWAGICNPAVEKLLTRFEHFDNRRELAAAARSLDRVLRHQYLVVPHWYSPNYNLIYRSTLHRPAVLPLYYSPQQWVLQTWWQNPKTIDSANKK